MAFIPDTQPTPVSIGDISLEIFDGDNQAVTYSIQVVMDDGSVTVKTGNAVPHLTQVHITGLQQLMEYVRDAAQGLIP